MVAAFVVATVVLVGVGGLLAAADAALGTLSRVDIVDLATQSRARGSLLAIAGDVGAHANAVNFARVVAEAFAAVLVTLAFAVTLDWWQALIAAAVIMVLISFVLVGSSPRSVGRAHAHAVLEFSALLVRFVRVVIGPLADLLVTLGNRVTPGRTRAFSSEEQLLSMVDEATEQSVLEEEDRELIHSIFEFNDTVVREVMVPRTEMVTIDGDETIDHAISTFLARGISRIPVTGEGVDEVLGVVYLRDSTRLAYESPDEATRTSVLELARPVVFVPESKKADDLMRQMQLTANHLAIVIDEYGGVAGLVTMEDLIEELVGEISDEYDRALDDVVPLDDGRYRVKARLGTYEVGELFDLELEDDDVDSIGGLLTKELGRLADAGDRVEVGGVAITAERVEGRRRRLVSVLVERTEAASAVSESMEERA